MLGGFTSVVGLVALGMDIGQGNLDFKVEYWNSLGNEFIFLCKGYKFQVKIAVKLFKMLNVYDLAFVIQKLS